MNKFIGFLSTMYLGVNKDKLEVVFMDDDGTRGKHLVFFLNNQPTSVIPLMNEDELADLIGILKERYEEFGFDKVLLKAKLELKDY